MLDIVIVNWNSGNQLLDCLRSIEDSKTQYYNKTIIIDNNSEDNSIEILEKENLNIKYTVYKNMENKGFGYACNQAIPHLESDYVLFLNPDTILKSDTLEKSVISFRDRKGLGVLGIQLLDENNNITKTCARFPKSINFFLNAFNLSNRFSNKYPPFHMIDWDHNNSEFVDHVIGAFYLIEKKLFLELNGFDEEYFVYLEDLDLSRRVRDLKYEVYYDANIKCFHKGGGTSDQVKAKRLYYSLQSRLIYANKYYSKKDFIFTSMLTIIIEPFSRLFNNIIRLNYSGFGETLKAYKMLYTYLLGIRKLGD